MVADIATKKTAAKATAIPRKQSEKKVCTACHRELPLSKFYMSNSPLHSLDKKTPICKDCTINNSINLETGEIDEVKFKKILMQLDKPFYKDSIISARNQYLAEHSFVTEEEANYKGADIIKIYMKNVASLRQLSSKSYSDSERDGFIQKNSTVIVQEKTTKNNTPSSEKDLEIKWSKKDKQNMKYVISMLGYDPYEEVGLSESDRKYCFNILSGYFDTDGIAEDGHKMQSVIEIAMLYCQCKKITEAINIELSKDDSNDSKVQKLTASKSSLLASISTIAKDNNIASNYNKNSKQGQNSLSSKMKEMEENGFSDIKVNFFDIKTSEAFRQIDEISNNNIANQLTLDSNEYTEIVKEQREMIQEYTAQIDTLTEENRKLKNQIIDLENKKR